MLEIGKKFRKKGKILLKPTELFGVFQAIMDRLTKNKIRAIITLLSITAGL